MKQRRRNINVMTAFCFFAVVSINFLPKAFADTPQVPRLHDADREVVVDSIDNLKEAVLDEKTQGIVFHQLLRSEGFEGDLPLLQITHLNQMSNRYAVDSMTYTLDGKKIYVFASEDYKDHKGIGKSVSIFKGPIVPGLHDLVVQVVYRGNESGVFSYLNQYKVAKSAEEKFRIDKGQDLKLKIVGFEKGWALTKFQERPGLKISVMK